MSVQIVEEDVQTLINEIEAAKEVGLNEIFFKFQLEEDFLVLKMEQAQTLLITLQSLMNSEVVHLSLDITQYL